MKEIQLSKGYVAKVDDADYELVIRHKWWAIIPNRSRTIYAYCTKLKTYMHRFVMGVGKGDRDRVDHVDHDGLNNQRKNLRVCTHQQNQRYQLVQDRPSKSSQFKGVCFIRTRKLRKPWLAGIKVDGRRINLGCFASEEEAATAYDVAARNLFGEYALTNF